MRAAVPAVAGRGEGAGRAFDNPGTAGAKDAASAYETLFGAEEKRVLATSSTADDARFAATLLEKAKSLADDPALLAMLYAKAYEFGIKDPAGYGSAVEAAKTLLAAGRSKKDEWRDKLADVYDLQVKRGTPDERSAAGSALLALRGAATDEMVAARRYADAAKQLTAAVGLATRTRSPRVEELRNWLKQVQAAQAAAERAAKLESQLTAKPDPDVARRVFDTYLLDLDDPAAAAKLSQYFPVASFRNMIKLACADETDLSEQDATALADWYRELGEKAAGMARVTATARAQGYYQRALSLHTARDGQRLTLEKGLSDVTQAEVSAAAAAGVSDFLLLWNADNLNANNRGTTAVNVVGYVGGKEVWRKNNVPVEYVKAMDVPTSIPVPRAGFDKIRVEIVAWAALGGALSEIQFFRGGRNIAEGRPAAVSAAFDGSFPARALTDGVLNSAVYQKGYWVLPDRTPGWAEVDLTPAAPPSPGKG